MPNPMKTGPGGRPVGPGFIEMPWRRHTDVMTGRDSAGFVPHNPTEFTMAHCIRDDDGVSNPSHNPNLDQVVETAIAAQPNRRRLLLGGLGVATLPFLTGLAGCGGDDDPAPVAAATEKMLGFTAVAASSADTVVVPAGYVASAIIPWGEPINSLAPAWKPDATNSAADQEQQVGDNHDGMWFFPFNAAGNASFTPGTVPSSNYYSGLGSTIV